MKNLRKEQNLHPWVGPQPYIYIQQLFGWIFLTLTEKPVRPRLEVVEIRLEAREQEACSKQTIDRKE